MSLLCFSLAATLRCAGIPRIQSEVLIIPPALEALTSLFLIWTVWRNGRKRWLLVAEAWMFLILAILDYVSHALVRGMSSVSVFEPMDKAVGALSGIPILAYTSFLFLLIRSDLLPTITPSILRTTLQFTLISLIPPTIMSYELGSLLGVTYRINPITLVPETGFANLTTRSLSYAFTTSSIVILSSFQLLIFLLCTWRISQAWDRASQPVFVSAMGGRARSNSTSTSYLGDERGIRGLSWLALGLAIGATETLLSLGAQTFILVLVRRILRVLARASLIYALYRGSSDGFSNLEEQGMGGMGGMGGSGGGEMGGIKRLISHPRFSTFAQLTPTATSFYNQRNPISDPSTPRSRVTVLYDLKSAPVLQMRFSGLDVPDSSEFRARSGSGSGSGSGDGSVATSMLGHGGHSTRTPLSRTRTLSEKRSGPPLASIQIPPSAVLSGVVATQSANSSRSSIVPPVPSLPLRSQSESQTRLALGSRNRSSSTQSLSRNRSNSNLGSSEEPGSYERSTSLEGVRELTNQFPVIPARAMVRRGPTQLAYAVQEEDEIDSSLSLHRRGGSDSSGGRGRGSSSASGGEYARERGHARTDTADSNLSPLSGMSSPRRKPVPAHTPRGTIIELPRVGYGQGQGQGQGQGRDRETNRPGIRESISGEQVVVDTHSALFPPERYDYTSSRASSDSGTFTLTATGTPSPAEIITGRPARLAERAAQLERQERQERQERLSGEEHAWMMRAPQVPVQMSQSVITRTPELKTVADFESSRVELEGAASPKSAWSARTRGSVLGLNMGMNTSQAGLWPGSNVEGWGRKLSDTDPSQVPPGLRVLATEEARAVDDSRWRDGQIQRQEPEFVRRSLVSNRSRHERDPFAGDEPHAL
ncbi:hypothetical protein RHS04_01108 [Rhizoctonia solani]|uniref:Uncharacterized protein n=1 Tax=Rhizoctonia solani TaxID=456999 RepID=A0A8H7HF27_9AGAM|nr:hypothetical protein RHS04_01108 [Rhizoctonia solani]